MINDQAQSLRRMVEDRQAPVRRAKILTVTSGKGGVGKSNFTLNFALTLQNRGYKVLIFDADIGMANIDVLLGISAPYNLYHLLKKQKTIREIIHTTPEGLQFIAGGSGFTELLKLSDEELDYVDSQISVLTDEVDYVIFDTGAGLSRETVKFILAADETIVVTTPEPTSITDAYALIKMVSGMGENIPFRLVVNRVANAREGKQTADKIRLVAERFLNLYIPVLGYVEDDLHVSRAVKQQKPFIQAFPNSPASRTLRQVVHQYLNEMNEPLAEQRTMRGFLRRMVKLLS